MIAPLVVAMREDLDEQGLDPAARFTWAANRLDQMADDMRSTGQDQSADTLETATAVAVVLLEALGLVAPAGQTESPTAAAVRVALDRVQRAAAAALDEPIRSAEPGSREQIDPSGDPDAPEPTSCKVDGCPELPVRGGVRCSGHLSICSDPACSQDVGLTPDGDLDTVCPKCRAGIDAFVAAARRGRSLKA